MLLILPMTFVLQNIIFSLVEGEGGGAQNLPERKGDGGAYLSITVGSAVKICSLRYTLSFVKGALLTFPWGGGLHISI